MIASRSKSILLSLDMIGKQQGHRKNSIHDVYNRIAQQGFFNLIVGLPPRHTYFLSSILCMKALTCKNLRMTWVIDRTVYQYPMRDSSSLLDYLSIIDIIFLTMSDTFKVRKNTSLKDIKQP
jgi:hypothetical protein